MSNEALAQIEKTFVLADRLHDTMFNSATTDEERMRVTSARDAARDAYWAAVAAALEDNNPMVAEIRASLKEANERLEQEIEQMESFAAALNMLSDAVKFAASLVTLAGV